MFLKQNAVCLSTLLSLLLLFLVPQVPAQSRRAVKWPVLDDDSTRAFPIQSGPQSLDVKLSTGFKDGITRMTPERVDDDDRSVLLPIWHGQFTYAGQRYSYRMIGTDPAEGSATTIVPTQLVPLRFVFSDGSVFDASTDRSGIYTPVEAVIHSPLFQSAEFTTGGTSLGVTQYVDAFQRANFWNYVSTVSPDYHVLLGLPQVLPVQTLVVPADKGYVDHDHSTGRAFGVIDEGWMLEQTREMIGQLGLDPHALSIFLAGPVFGQFSEAIHGVVNVPTQSGGPTQTFTFVRAGYPDAGMFGGRDADINALSHEIADWLDDP